MDGGAVAASFVGRPKSNGVKMEEVGVELRRCPVASAKVFMALSKACTTWGSSWAGRRTTQSFATCSLKLHGSKPYVKKCVAYSS